MVQMRNTKLHFEKSNRKESFGRSRHRLKDNMNLDVKQ
jgi:hypothetical protein